MAHAAWLQLALTLLLSLPTPSFAGQPGIAGPSPRLPSASTPFIAPQDPPARRVRPHRDTSRAALEVQAATDDLWLNVQKVSAADLVYAKALAEASGTPGSTARAACWGAWIRVLASAQAAGAGVRGMSLQNASDALASRYEQLAQVADNFQPGQAFMVACEPVARAQKMHLSVWVAAVAGGAVPLQRLAPGL